MSAVVVQTPVATAHSEASAVAICWKNNKGVFVPNDLPIHLELGTLSADMSLETARQVIAQLARAVERADEVQAILEAPAGAGP